jgi:predicted acylesterase/phospholipase RssA
MALVRLVLSGGSAKGLLECTGAVTALADRGHEVAIGAGTSAGGIILGGLAAGRAPSEIRNVLMETDLTRFVNTDWRSWLRLAFRGSLSDGSALLAFLQHFTRGKKFKDAHFDLRLTAANFSQGCPRVFTQEADPEMDLALGMRITSALPLAFSAVEYEGDWYKDGGVYANVPVEASRTIAEATVIFAIAQSPEGGQAEPTPWKADVGLVKEVGRTIDLLIDANIESQMDEAPEHAVKVFSDGLGYGTLDFDLTTTQKQELYDHGYALMLTGLEEAGL